MTDDPDSPQAVFDRSTASLTEGREALSRAHRELRAVLSGVSNARGRGRINHRIWEIERALDARPRFFSQSGQDRYLDEHVFGGKTGGTFLEVGGYDGATGSNCLFFETFRNWTGILVEPSPTQFAKASTFRRAECLQVAVADVEGEAEFLDIEEGYTQMSGLTASYAASLRETVEADPRHRGNLITVPITTLPAILDERGLTEIDYISLDVEGGEMAILSAFPFDKYHIAAWTIENNQGGTEIPQLMADRGYRRIEALGVDDVFVRA